MVAQKESVKLTKPHAIDFPSYAVSHEFVAIYASSIQAVHGINRGEKIGVADTLYPDDVYRLTRRFDGERLGLDMRSSKHAVIVECRNPKLRHAQIEFNCLLTFISSIGKTVEMVCFTVTAQDGGHTETMVLPMSRLQPDMDYCLISIDEYAGRQRFAQYTTPAFEKSTKVQLFDGSQVCVGALRPGDQIYAGLGMPATTVQTTVHRTLRMSGMFAPIQIQQGALGNTSEADIVVSADSRVLVYPRRAKHGHGASAARLARARYMVNGMSFKRLNGGFFEFVYVLLNKPGFVYAGGLGFETCRVDVNSRKAFPELDDVTLDQLQKAHSTDPSEYEEMPRESLLRPDSLFQLRAVPNP